MTRRVSLDEVTPHRLGQAPQRDGLGESEPAPRQEGRILVRRALPPPDVDEHLRHLGVPGEVVEEARSVGVMERGFPGPHRVQQVTPRSPVRFVEQ